MPDDSLTRLSYWFPLVESAGLPVPETRIVKISDQDMRLLFTFCLDGEGDPTPWHSLTHAIEMAALSLPKPPPVFLRTDFLSGKHSWVETCYVADLSLIPTHVSRLIEKSETFDFVGCPWDVWVVREFLNTRPQFHAFQGMPITREFRYFVRDGVIEHRQPYWPEYAIEGNFYRGAVEPEDWRSTLSEMNRISANEDTELSRLTLETSAAVPGFWSVDWLQTADRGWVLTDMAEGDKSFRWEP